MLLIAATLLCAGFSASAAVSPSAANCAAGQTVELKYTFKGIMGLDGILNFSDPEMISGIEVSVEPAALLTHNPNATTFNLFAGKKNDYVVTVKYTLASNAKIGDKCEVILQYETTEDGDMPAVPDYKYDKSVITVIEKLDHTKINKLIDQAEGLKSSAYTSETWKKLDSALKNAKSVAKSATTQKALNEAASSLESAIKGLEKVVDYSELNKQIKIAEALVEKNYTSTSWSAVKTALAAAKKAQSSKDQSVVNSAAKALKSAIADLIPAGGLNYDELNKQIEAAEKLNANEYEKTSWAALTAALDKAKQTKTSKVQSEIDSAAGALKKAIESLVKLDLTRLQAALDGVNVYTEDGSILLLWDRLQELLKEAEAAKNAGDQVAVDNCAAAIEALTKEIQEKLAELGATPPADPSEPVGDFCNINSHPVWMILFWISLAVNLVGIGLVVAYVIIKKKSADNTPLVDYDITDDAE